MATDQTTGMPRQDALLEWWAERRRDLPWRRTRDPWSILVSEVMLQQTQVVRVVPKYEAFLRRFPDVGSCAAASVDEVIGAWVGLGYNRRAVQLHRCAAVVVAEHGSSFPEDLDALLVLPGIGPYTARAVLAFAFEQDVGVVDTNVGRVLARWSGAPLSAKEAQPAADAAVPVGSGWAWNQAMFDLGASVCTKRVARCDDCPVRRWCRWQRSGAKDPDPAVGSAFVSGRQSTFAGSDRQGRGRLVDAMRAGEGIGAGALAEVAGWPDDSERARRVAESLVADGLASWDGTGGLSLPGRAATGGGATGGAVSRTSRR